ncbi:lipid asymmetry maintenance ABC transporter permease subunit MlaE [Aquirhabdus parva]|uniref:Intermembrane phospholipid transport system permease protein MlaE n=1 Tax=Aquirhabdus parva TaxID=2283318 RepID=A0A345P8H3_9GAMM|nr:lipid asymmetry maintenance ABC transporter permease subunit MlaE [Aquirhabdus parva]AXI03582.1 lipid asymmetry maintenance ABC transporter permease subunit MlaE [Aquirhabdus parva]
MKWIQLLGRDVIDRITGIGAAGVLLARSAFGIPKWSGIGLFGQQMYRVGVMSLLIILVSGLFIGLVLGLQGFTILSKYGSSQALGTMVALTLVRELGPVITALLFAGRAGSALTAEIGLMKATEQLASMEMIGVDPLKRIVAPRLWAGLISMPMLAIVFSAVGILGGKLVGVDWLGVDEGSFWNSMQVNVNFTNDVINGVIKSVVFGVVCTWIAVYQGYAATPTSEGISTATTNTVVYSSLCVLGLDFILTAVMFGGLS